jgi:N-acetyl-gamma-glutamyl-phosphate reductase
VSCYREYYASAALVRVREPDAAYAPPNAYKGVDDMDIFVEGNDARLLLIARFDNLGKGASGAAVQCLNLSIGAEETKGLVTKC